MSIELIRKIDLVGYSPKIFFQDNNKYKSVLGGIITLLILILTVLATISFGQDIYLRVNPTILLNKNFIEPMRNMSQQTVIGYRLFYTGGVRIPDLDKLVDIFVLHSQFDPKLSSAFLTRYEVIKCSQADSYKNNYLNLTSLIGNPDDYYCFPNNINLTLKGKYGAPINNHMHMRIAICQNTTENGNRCYPDAVIRQKMASFFVSFIYRDSYIDSKDYLGPVKYYITSNTIKSSSYNFRQDAYLYKDVDFGTDSGLILPDEHIDRHSQLDTISPGSTADANTLVFTNVIVGLTNIKDSYERKYVKIQDITAQVGGIIKFFLIFADFFLSFFNYVPFLDSLYDTIFNLEIINPKKQDNKLKQNLALSKIENDSVVPIVHSVKIANNFRKDQYSQFKENPPFTDNKPSTMDYRPKKHSLSEIIFRCFRVNKYSSKYCYLSKISTHYQSNYDLTKIISNNSRLSSLYNYSFNQSERDLLNLFAVNNFYELSENKVILLPRQDEDVRILKDSDLFNRLNIPRHLFIRNERD